MSSKLTNPRNQVTPRSDEENNVGSSNANVGGDDIDFSSFEREWLVIILFIIRVILLLQLLYDYHYPANKISIKIIVINCYYYG